MQNFLTHRPAMAVTRPARSADGLSETVFYFMTAVAVIQGGHLVEHFIQAVQVFVLGVPEDKALGLLGYVLQFNGTEEWLHLGYNSFYLLSLYALIIPLWHITPAVITKRAFWIFIAASVWIESWHMVEHGVIISHVIANGGFSVPRDRGRRAGAQRHDPAPRLQPHRLPRHRLRLPACPPASPAPAQLMATA